jgi:molecular chaperone GrpE
MKPGRKEHKESKAKEAEIQELREKMADLEKEKDELLGKLQRVSADYANFQKRVPKQIADSVGYEKERVFRSLLPALDNFERTLQNARSAESVDTLVEGIRIIYDQMLDILKSHEVAPTNALGEIFDPSRHEAVMQKSEPEQQENVVLEELQKGYTLNGRVIRPSKVIVNMPITRETPQQEPGASQKQRDDEFETTDTE